MFASTIGLIGHPFCVALAWALVALYAVIPNYAIAIALLTVLVMIVLFPLTLKGARVVARVQLLVPELKRIQSRHAPTPEMSVEKQREERRLLNEETVALYKENDVSATGAFFPVLLQLPLFLILTETIRGLASTTTTRLLSGASVTRPDPLYISTRSRLYKSILHAGGALNSFGVNLAHSLHSAGAGWSSKVPFVLLILFAIGLQYLQMRQISGRYPGSTQTGRLQKVMPVVFGLIYLAIPAGVNLYFIVSSVFRLAQQELMYRRDPQLRSATHELRRSMGGPEPA